MTKSKKSMDPGEERRKEPRIPAKFGIRFKEARDAAVAFKAFSVNFSVGGLCIRTDKVYEVGTSLQLNLAVGRRTFDLQACVAWARRDAIGVRFENVDPSVRRELEEIADSLLEQAEGADSA